MARPLKTPEVPPVVSFVILEKKDANSRLSLKLSPVLQKFWKSTMVLGATQLAVDIVYECLVPVDFLSTVTLNPHVPGFS